ncbi:MAG: HAMP domain-containing protein [Ignavibacteriales bacterium]|nr:HAMP domain-containing protein [Ignavibacteriales bacterium]
MNLTLSIRTKLTLWYALVLTLILIFFGTAAYFYTKRTLSESLDITLRNEVNWLRQYLQERAELQKKKKKRGSSRSVAVKKPAKEVKDSITFSPYPSEWTEADSIWYQIYEHAMRNPKKTLINVRNNKGIAFYRSENLDENDSLYFSQQSNGEIILTTYRTSDNEERRVAYTQDANGDVWVAYPMSELDTILDNLFKIFLIISPVALLIAMGGGWFIAYSSLKPVDEITRAAQQISASNLGQQIPGNYLDDEIGRLAATFNEMIARLHSSFEHTRQFSMDASHELRTPLTIMRGEIELALRDESLTEETREVLLSLLDEVLRMNAIIENLMLLSKSDLNLYKPMWETVDLHDIVSELYEDGIHLAYTKQINVTLEQNDEVVCMGDTLRLRQLFLNLLDNAIKYTPEHGSIRLALQRNDGIALVKVEDSGIGISQEEIPKIFNRFYRIDKARSREMGGSGLGLSIAKWIVDLHGGKILVQSTVNKGTTFIVKLPLKNTESVPFDARE